MSDPRRHRDKMSIVYPAFEVAKGLLYRLDSPHSARPTPSVFNGHLPDAAPSPHANGQTIYPLAPLGAPALRGSLPSPLFFSSPPANRQLKQVRLCHRRWRRFWTHAGRSIDRRPHRYVTSSAYCKVRILISTSQCSCARSRAVRQ